MISKIPFFVKAFLVLCTNFQIRFSTRAGGVATSTPLEPQKKFVKTTFKMNSLKTLFFRAPQVVISTTVYVCIGAVIGCTVEKRIMPNVKKITGIIQCEKRRALANLIAQCSLTAIFAEYLKIIMANKGSPGAISFGMATFVMQTSIKEYIKIVFC